MRFIPSKDTIIAVMMVLVPIGVVSAGLAYGITTANKKVAADQSIASSMRTGLMILTARVLPEGKVVRSPDGKIRIRLPQVNRCDVESKVPLVLICQ